MAKEILIILALVFVTLIVYSSGLFGDFVWDDDMLITKNPFLKVSEPTSLFNRQFFPPSGWNNPGYYRPICSLSLWLDLKIWGQYPFGFHLTNVFLHIICVLLFYWLLKNFIPVKKKSVVWLSAAVFALHPYHTESVTFISGRTDVLATLFILLALMAYIIHRKTGRAVPLYLSTAAYIIGLLSKEVAVALIPIIILWELLLNRKEKLGLAFVSLSPIIFVTLAYLPFRSLLLGLADKTLYAPAITQGFWVRLFYAPYFLAKYIVMLSAPYTFNSYRLARFFVIDFGIREILTIVIIFGYLGLIFALLKAKKKESVFWMLFVFSGLLPVLNIIPICGASMAERFLYLPSLGFSVIVAIGIISLDEKIRARKPKSSPGIILATTLLLSYAGTTYIRNFDWQNELMVFHSILKADKNSTVGHTGLASTFVRMGEYDSTVIHAQAALARDPWLLPAWQSMGLALSRMGKHSAAEWALRQALVRSPRDANVYNNLGVVAEARGDIEEAAENFRIAVGINPLSPTAHLNLGRLLYGTGEFDEALALLERARQLDPYNPIVHKALSETYEALGENEKARRSWQMYLKLPGVKVGEFTGDEDAPGVIRRSKGRRK